MTAANPNPPLDFKALPKIELHAHLGGSISPQTLHKVWLQKKASNPARPLADPLLALAPGENHSAHDLASFFTVLRVPSIPRRATRRLSPLWFSRGTESRV